MRREQLLHLARAAADQTGSTRILVLGSQSILGSFEADGLPSIVTNSMEADVIAIDGPPDSHFVIEANLGRSTMFHHQNDYYADGMVLEEATLPSGWDGRVVELEAFRVSHPQAPARVFCLEPHDLCAAKLARSDDRDVVFVAALLRHGAVDERTIAERIQLLGDAAARQRAEGGLRRTSTVSRTPDLPPPPVAEDAASARNVLARRKGWCGATTKTGRTCRNPPEKGRRHCHLH